MTNTEQTSLTAPKDMDPNYKHPVRDRTPLNDEQTESGMNVKTEKSYIQKFPERENFYADPPVSLQKYALFSFVPAKGATPDEDGVYGMAKIRGSFDTVQEADERAELLIRNVDSYHKVYYAYVGRPFPCTEEGKFSADVREIEVKKKIAEVQSESIREKKREEQQVINEIKDREKKLLEENKQIAENDGVLEEDPTETYTMLRTKKAQLIWTYKEHQKKMAEIEDILVKTQKDIETLDAKSDEYSKVFYDKYMEARRNAGLPDTDDSFIKYMVEDVELPFMQKNQEE